MPDPDPLDDFLAALREAANLYATDNVASRIAAVSATISFLRATTDDNDRSLTTPLMDVLGRLEDEAKHLLCMADADEDGNRSGRGNTKSIKTSLDDASVSAVITLARRAGKTLPVAATMVAEHLGLGAHDSLAVKQLLQSRKNLMSRRAAPEALAIYDLMIAKAAEAGHAGMSPNEALSLALEYLRARFTAQSS
jgi:hypothetical protein